MSIFDPGDRPKLNRRQSLQLGAAATAAGLLGTEELATPAQAASGSGSDGGGGDPARASGNIATRLFADEMPNLNTAPYLAREVPLASLQPPPGKYSVPGEARRLPHRAWDTHPPVKYYELFQRKVRVKLHADLPEEDMWGFQQKGDPVYPTLAWPGGPTFHTKEGQPILVRIWNLLGPASRHQGYGMPETTTHLHDNHNTEESDGNADDYYPKLTEHDAAHRDEGLFKDFHWINKPAGVDPKIPNSHTGDPTETMGSLWYHDHRHDFTAANTYKGLIGMYTVFDNIDNDNEAMVVDSSLPLDQQPLKLPSGKYDVPSILADKMIDSSGHLVFDQLEMDGILGNKFTLNGKIQPHFKVEPRQYRIRVLNPGPSRVFGSSLKVAANAVGDMRGATNYPHAWAIGFDGMLLTHALPFVGPGMRAPAQRVVLLIDFKPLRDDPQFVGKHLYVVNEFAQSNGNKPDGFVANRVTGPEFRAVLPGVPVCRFDLIPSTGPDLSTPIRQFVSTALGGGGRTLRELPPFPAGVNELSEAAILAAVGKKYPFPSAPSVATVRDWRFDRTNGQWAVNNRLYDGEHPAALCKKDTAEIWIFRNNSGGWLHPMHVHFEKFRTLYRANGLKPLPDNPRFGRGDTMALGPGERAVILLRFRDFTGKYLMHCHNTVHEDHAMMVRWDIVK